MCAPWCALSGGGVLKRFVQTTQKSGKEGCSSLTLVARGEIWTEARGGKKGVCQGGVPLKSTIFTSPERRRREEEPRSLLGSTEKGPGTFCHA